MQGLIDILGSGNPMFAKDDVLLEDNHPAVVRHIKHMIAAKRERYARRPGNPRNTWIDTHISKHGILHWLDNAASAADDDILALSFPGIRTLTIRQRDACIIFGIPLPDPERRIVNLSYWKGHREDASIKCYRNCIPPCWKDKGRQTCNRYLLADRVRF